MSRLRVRNRDRVGALLGATSDTTAPSAAIRSIELAVAGGISAIDAAGKHGHRRRSDRQGAPVARGVDPVCRTGHDNELALAQFRGQLAGDLVSVSAAGPGTHHGDRAVPEQRQPRWSPHPQADRRRLQVVAAGWPLGVTWHEDPPANATGNVEITLDVQAADPGDERL